MNAEQESQVKLVNKRTIASRYGVSQRTIQDWMQKNDVPFYKFGYIVRFDPLECDKAVAKFMVPTE